MRLAVFFVILAAKQVFGGFVSAVADPGMTKAPHVMIEGWNMCNRAGGAPFANCSIAPRWADCASDAGGPGPNGNLVTEEDNDGGLSASANETECDPFTQEKERKLAAICQYFSDNPAGFWSGMLKSGNYIYPGACCKQCGLWCAPSCCPNSSDPEAGLAFNNLPMNQPLVTHQWSAKDSNGHWAGSFSGTWDIGAGVQADMCTNLTGTWVGTDKDHPVTVQQTSSTTFVAHDAAWTGPRMGTLFANGSAKLTSEAGTHWGSVGRLNATSPECTEISWDDGPWCREPYCSGPPLSYFELSWRADEQGNYIYRNVLRISENYPWLMLYTGADAGQGRKGGYPWDGRGQMTRQPQSSPHWSASKNEFNVSFFFNLTSYQESSSFYFLNTASCWKVNGSQCNGDIRTDVTIYILLDLHQTAENEPRCAPHAQHHCPPYHRTPTGEAVHRSNVTHFPYHAYLTVGGAIASHEHNSSEVNFLGFDPWSNPQQQAFVKVAPAPEWGVYGFPTSKEEALTPRMWNLNVGGWTSATSLPGVQEPEFRNWTTLNVGPEMGLGGGTGEGIWEISKFDVQVQE